MRPQNLEEIVGQEHLLGKRGLITLSVKRQRPLSLLLWGPPGCGKTTLAFAYAKAFQAKLIPLSATSSGSADIKKWVETFQTQPLLYHQPILFIDEIHRYNKAQQDLILPHLEKGLFVLIGATTENPSFALNDALLSRLRVVKLHPLMEEDLDCLLKRYEARFSPLALTPEARKSLFAMADGDARHLFNIVENIQISQADHPLSVEELVHLAQRRAPLYDRTGEGHYSLISALHKSVRGSDPDAALYWLTRMLQGGEDPLFIARRMIRMASEDVGLADPDALGRAIAARNAYEVMGSPEGELALAQMVIYLALAPKSNAVYKASQEVEEFVKQTGSPPPPAIIVNAPHPLMKELGYGKGYLYDHDQPNAFSGQDYFPDNLPHRTFYDPVERGFEREMRKRIRYFSELKKTK